MKKAEISILNVLFCLMVIFIHVTSYPITSLAPHSVAVKFLFFLQKFCGVAVYGFIFLSGLKFFLNKKTKVNLAQYYISRIRKVFIPYLLITVLYYLYEVKRGYFIFDIKELITFFINGNVECHLYFVVIIMQFYVLFPLWRKLTEKKALFVLGTGFILNIIFVYYMPQMLEKVGIQSFLYNDRIFSSYLFFWLLGCFCGKYYDEFKMVLKKYKLILPLMFALFLALDVWLSYSSFSGVFMSRKTEFVHLLYCVFAILFLYYFAEYFSNFKIVKNKLLIMIDNASYEIYLIHILFVHIVNDLIAKIQGIGVLKAYAVRFLFVYLVSISSCILYKKLTGYIFKNKI